MAEKVQGLPPNDVKDLFLAPYYDWLVEVLQEAIGPDTEAGETPEVPRYETSRGPPSAGSSRRPTISTRVSPWMRS